MLDLQHLKPEHKNIIEKYIPDCCKKMCDFSFGNLYIWRYAEHTEFCVEGDFLFLRSTFNGVTSYAVPWGNGDMNKALSRVCEDARKRDADLSFYCVSPEQIDLLQKYFGDKLVITPQRDYFDYIYTSEKLAALSGRRFHSKKNHVNSFTKKYNFVTEELNDSNLEECLEFSHRWHMMNESTQRLEAERQAIDCAFHRFDQLGFRGILLRVYGEIVAYALGEALSDGETFCVHFEKADPGFPGAYAVINNQFAKMLCNEYKYLNREDDAGVEGLRKAKTSYQPEFFVEKYYAKII